MGWGFNNTKKMPCWNCLVFCKTEINWVIFHTNDQIIKKYFFLSLKFSLCSMYYFDVQKMIPDLVYFKLKKCISKYFRTPTRKNIKFIKLDFFPSLTLSGPAFCRVSHGPGGGLILAPPWYLSPEASEWLVLNMTIVGYPLKNFLRYITCL